MLSEVLNPHSHRRCNSEAAYQCSVSSWPRWRGFLLQLLLHKQLEEGASASHTSSFRVAAAAAGDRGDIQLLSMRRSRRRTDSREERKEKFIHGRNNCGAETGWKVDLQDLCVHSTKEWNIKDIK